jgi:aspartate aminotransferase-like enzyme
MFALDYQLDNILAEGLENRYARHLAMAKTVREWAKKHFDMFVEESYASNTLTTVKNTRGIDVSALNKALGDAGFQISNGYGELKDKTFRIAHMADTQPETLAALLTAIENILKLEA